MKKEKAPYYSTVAEYNAHVYVATSIITGPEFRRLKRAGKI